MKKILYLSLIMICLFISTTMVFAQTLNPANGHYYELVQADVDWYQARDAAAAMTFNGIQGHLATVTSSNEDSFLVNTFPEIGGTDKIWIGGTDEASEDTWLWITGETWNYTNWDAGEPNNVDGVEDCLQYTDGIPLWNDENCDNVLPYYIVEFDTTISIPTMSEWGMIIFAVLAGFGSVYYLRRQRRA